MRDVDCSVETSYYVKEQGCVAEMSDRVKEILDAKYEKADLDQIASEQDHLDSDERAKLRMLLGKYEDLFDGTLGKWRLEPYDIELQPGAKPYHARPYPVPKAYKRTLRMEVERLCEVGVLKKINCSEWAAPTFIIPKTEPSDSSTTSES